MATKTKTNKQTLAAARKEAATPCYKTSGRLAAGVEERMRYYMKDTPAELHAVWASLLAFDDVIIGGCCGKNNAELLGDDGTGEAYFMVETFDPQNEMNQYQFIVTPSTVIGQLMMNDGKGSAEFDEPFRMTLAGLHNFLRQLPRHANAFAVE